MTLTELRYIVAVARELHFGRAAQVCFVSQPTLSVAVKKIEDELGVVIFERGKQDVKVTPLGATIVAQANHVLDEVRKIKELASTGKDELKTVLRMGVIYTVGPYLLPSLIPQLRALAPIMPLVVQEDYTDNVREKLLHGDLDVIIVSLPFANPLLNVEPVYTEPFVVLLPHNNHLCALEKIPADRMKNENVLMLGSVHCFRQQVLDACPGCVPINLGAATTNTMVEGTSLETIRYMVASGMGVTVVPLTVAARDLGPDPLLAVRQFVAPVPERTIVCAWRKTFPRPKAVAAVLQAIRQCKDLRVNFIGN